MLTAPRALGALCVIVRRTPCPAANLRSKVALDAVTQELRHRQKIRRMGIHFTLWMWPGAGFQAMRPLLKRGHILPMTDAEVNTMAENWKVAGTFARVNIDSGTPAQACESLKVQDGTDKGERASCLRCRTIASDR